MKKIIKITASVLAFSLALLGCQNGTTTTEEVVVPAETTTETATNEATKDQATVGTEESAVEVVTNENTGSNTKASLENATLFVTLDSAKAAFYDTFASTDINIDSVAVDRENGVIEYKVSGFQDNNEYELVLNGETGEILKYETDTDNDDTLALNFDNIISPEEAMEKAVAAKGDGYIVEWDLEAERDGAFYDFDIENGKDIRINAETGEVL